jgi:hypothetical protein
LGNVGLLLVDEIKLDGGRAYSQRQLFDSESKQMPVSWMFLEKGQDMVFLHEETLITRLVDRPTIKPDLGWIVAGVSKLPTISDKNAYRFVADYKAEPEREYYYHLVLPRCYYSDNMLIFNSGDCDETSFDIVTRKPTHTQNITWTGCKKRTRFLIYFFGEDQNRIDQLLNNDVVSFSDPQNRCVSNLEFSKAMDWRDDSVKDKIREHVDFS